jgi:hypothetical protein
MIVVHFTKVSAMYAQVVISSLPKQLEKPPFCHSLHFLWCMAQRSLHAVTKVHYRRRQSCFATVFLWLGSPLAVLRFPCDSSPSYTLWIRTRPASFPTPTSKTHNLQHPQLVSKLFYTKYVAALVVLGCLLLRLGP